MPALAFGDCTISLAALYYDLMPEGVCPSGCFAGPSFIFLDWQSTCDEPTNHISAQTVVFSHAFSPPALFGFTFSFCFLP
ncbi:MAG: hypothetical protein GX946_12205 [Oligosphaeraceae bacterium]|nr:hypothetical protein [Oligosphaeraceae bacterium]